MKTGDTEPLTNPVTKLISNMRTKVRYRLIWLVTAPMMLTLVLLIGISFYWTTQYTWQNTLESVSDKLKVAENSIEILQSRQRDSLRYFANSYHFKSYDKLSKSDDEVNAWIAEHNSQPNFDYIRWTSIRSLADKIRYERLAKSRSYFDVLTADSQKKLDPSLPAHARVSTGENEFETRGMFSRTIYPVRDDKREIVGYLESYILLNNSNRLVDRIRDLIYPHPSGLYGNTGTVTIFLDDLRISTNVPVNDSGDRAIGTRVSDAVRNKVLLKGENYLNYAYVYNRWYISAYQPLYNQDDLVVGMLYIGQELWPMLKVYLINLAEIACVVILVMTFTVIFAYRNSKDLFTPIEKIANVVDKIRAGDERQRIGTLGISDKHELSLLASQFDAMLDLLSEKNRAIQSAANLLEFKVERRTASLKQKTDELEQHIELLHHARDRLVTSEKLAALGKLTAGIAHEINNPVAVILGNIELIKLEMTGSNTDLTEEVTTILQQVDRINNITSSLLQYSRSGGVQDMLALHDINEIVKEGITLVHTGSNARRIHFVTYFAASGEVECNRNQMLQVIVNILMNAIQSMNSEGSLTVMTENWLEESKALGCIVHIQDKGCGIHPDALNTIFDPFYTTKSDGTGLGLAVSQSLINRLGGQIKVKSEPGSGSTFSIYLKSYADSHT